MDPIKFEERAIELADQASKQKASGSLEKVL